MARNDTVELYAAYFEAVDLRTDIETGVTKRGKREQWVILPPLPERLCPGDTPATEYMTLFHREQRRPDHRAVWQFRRIDSTFKGLLAGRLEFLASIGWELGPVITCEVDPSEMAQILREKKTPYRVLQRLQKVAKTMYGRDIT